MEDLSPGGPRYRCERYHRDGTPCPHRTDYADRWCREDDCPGYTRPRSESAPPSRGPARGTPRRSREATPQRLPLDVDEVDLVRISQRAQDSFRFHHGGSAEAARAQLRTMLEDFVLNSARRRRGGFVLLARAGYELVLDGDLTTLTGYSTVHRERTWAQLRSGVPSRFGGGGRGGRAGVRGSSPPGPTPAAGPRVPVDDLGAILDPAGVFLTARVRGAFARLAGMRSAADEELDAVLRERLQQVARTMRTAGPREREDGVVEVDHEGWRWLVRSDARVVIGVAEVPQE